MYLSSSTKYFVMYLSTGKSTSTFLKLTYKVQASTRKNVFGLLNKPNGGSERPDFAGIQFYFGLFLCHPGCIKSLCIDVDSVTAPLVDE